MKNSKLASVEQVEQAIAKGNHSSFVQKHIDVYNWAKDKRNVQFSMEVICDNS